MALGLCNYVLSQLSDHSRQGFCDAATGMSHLTPWYPLLLTNLHCSHCFCCRASVPPRSCPAALGAGPRLPGEVRPT
jgi:hypothetical protein